MKSFFLFALVIILNNKSSLNGENNSKSLRKINLNDETISLDIIGDFNRKVIVFNPEKLIIKITNNRPEFNPETFLCIPAAYTTKENKIDGLYILNGKMLNDKLNNKLTGACLLLNNKIEILNLEELNRNFVNKPIASNASLFQQTLLIHESSIIKCELFGNKKNVRRALVQDWNKAFGICESMEPLTINEFQHVLIKNGITNAVNLDMGSWSEGWIKNKRKNKIIIGENFTNTSRQTNWIIFKK